MDARRTDWQLAQKGRRQDAAGYAQPLRPGGPHKDSSGAPNVPKSSRQDAGVGLASPNGHMRAAGRGVGAQPAVHGRPHAHTPGLKGSAGMDAGGALVDREPSRVEDGRTHGSPACGGPSRGTSRDQWGSDAALWYEVERR